MTEEDAVCAIYGSSEESYRLIDFLEKNDICDLHSANWGIKQNGDIVLIDYSGYF